MNLKASNHEFKRYPILIPLPGIDSFKYRIKESILFDTSSDTGFTKVSIPDLTTKNAVNLTLL